jgi:uncharacterized protein YceH (UPF0502 family)
MSLTEPEVSAALEELRDRNLVYVFYGSTSRVPKYKHMLPSVYELEPDEVAVVAVLLLRGPQTLGELRERSGRMHEFANLGETQETLDRLMRRDDPLVVRLPVQPGRKEARFAHLLSGEIDVAALAAAQPSRAEQAQTASDRITKLEEEVASLKAMFEEFKKQFE